MNTSLTSVADDAARAPRRTEQTQAGRAETALKDFRNRVLIQALVCALPASGLLALGSAGFAGMYFWGLLIVLLFRLAVMRRGLELLSLVIAVAPLINLLRGVAPSYSFVTVLLVGAVVVYNLLARPTAKVLSVLRQFPLAPVIVVYFAVFYLFSLFFTGQYDSNLRFFEFTFAAIITLIVGRHRDVLVTSVLALGLSAVAVGLAMLPHIGTTASERLGSIVVQGRSLGNPVTLGTPLALLFLGLVLDGGRWLGLQGKFMWRLLFLAPTIMLLALTSSRAAWLVASAGILLAFLFHARSRVAAVLIIVVAAVGIQLVLQSPFGEPLKKGIDRTFSKEGDRTSGRTDQWELAYYVVTTGVDRLLFGYGPGKGPEVYALYSQRVQSVRFAVGEKMAWHALYMQLAVEAGLLGLLPFLIWFAVALAKTFAWTIRQKLILPLVALVGYGLIILTVSGNDSVSGVFAGIGLLATASGTASVPSRGRTEGRRRSQPVAGPTPNQETA